MEQDPLFTYIVQAGGFGIAAYLVYWLTRGLNGKLDRLADAIVKMTDTLERHLDEQDKAKR